MSELYPTEPLSTTEVMTELALQRDKAYRRITELETALRDHFEKVGWHHGQFGNPAALEKSHARLLDALESA